MGKPKILIVEDEAIVAVDLRERLTALGYAVVGVAASGESALRQVARHSPDLALLDIVIKGNRDGIETAQAIRDQHDVPVIYLTAYADHETLNRAKATQPFAYLIKPFEERELHVAIEIALYKHSMERELRCTRRQLQERVAELQEQIAIKEEAEAQVRRLNRSLEQRVAERTAKLQEANKDMEAFVYSVSHDLRAPLRAIHGFAEILVRRYAVEADPDAGRYMRNILQASDQMGRLIEDLLVYAQVGRRAVRSQAIDFGDLVSRVSQQLAGRIAATGASIQPPCDSPPMCGDATLLSQILTNLVDNALTYHKAGVPPYIAIGCRRQNEGICIWVRDNGIGIAPGCGDKIFNAFQRLHSHEDYPGSGIGLAIVKRAAELMGGKTKVDSMKGKGSTFSIWLPQGNPTGRSIH